MAKTLRLTHASIESAQVKTSDIWLSDDDGSRGSGRLALRITSAGNKLFYFRYFMDGKRVLVPLGAYSRTSAKGRLTLDEARDVAMNYSFNIRKVDGDLRAELLARLSAPSPRNEWPSAVTSRNGRSDEKPAEVGTVLDLCNAYTTFLGSKKAQSTRNSQNIIKNHVQPTQWALIPANEITAEQIAEMIRLVVTAGHTTTAKNLRQILLAAFNLAKSGGRNPLIPNAIRQFHITNNPVAETASMSGEVQPRDRTPLSRAELGHTWMHLMHDAHDLSVAHRALRLTFLLGGQRCLQLLRCKVTDVNLDNDTILILDGKGRRRTPRLHLLPLTSQAKNEVRALLQMATDLGSPFLIPGLVKGQPLSNTPISNTIGKLSKKLLAKKLLGESFCYANIRSTIESTMAELDIAPHIRAEIQSHDMGGVQKKHYDKFAYMPQKRHALEIWAKYLEDSIKIVTNSKNNGDGAKQQ